MAPLATCAVARAPRGMVACMSLALPGIVPALAPPQHEQHTLIDFDAFLLRCLGRAHCCARRGPGQGVRAGSVVDDLGSVMDLFPTILSLAGVDMPKDRAYDGCTATCVVRIS